MRALSEENEVCDEFPDCNSGLNWVMATKCCTELRVTQKRSPIAFVGHLSDCKVQRDKKNPQFRSQLCVSELKLQFEFSDGFEVMHRDWCSLEEALCCFPRSSILFLRHTDGRINDLNPIWSKITRSDAAIKSFRFALSCFLNKFPLIWCKYRREFIHWCSFFTGEIYQYVYTSF